MWPFIDTLRVRRRLARLAAFTAPQVLDLSHARRVLVFAPHPDDETIGCGGTLIRLAQLCPVTVVLVTDGSGGEGGSPILGPQRQAEFRRATASLGVSSLEFLHEPDGALMVNSKIAERLQRLVEHYRPNWVMLPSPLENHRDHMCLTAMLTPLCTAATGVERLIFYEVWTPLPATHIVDITDQVAQKQAALAEHATSLAFGDYARAIEGLNRYRGLYLGRNRWAEAFMVEPVGGHRYFRRLLDIGLDVCLAGSARCISKGEVNAAPPASSAESGWS